MQNGKSKKVSGSFIVSGNETYYKIENYDLMPDFFMTITSSSDVWNFLWSKGGITAGRIDADHAIFPYYTADIVSDVKYNTGPFSALKIYDAKKNTYVYWQPFDEPDGNAYGIENNLYKSTNGSKIIFEEILLDYGLTFRRMYTSSERFGLVCENSVRNNGSYASVLHVDILNGCQNVMPACTDAALQNAKSILLDAYKQTDLDSESDLVVFGLSAAVTDKPEPSEALYANVCWFSDDAAVFLDPLAPRSFKHGEPLVSPSVLTGRRGACFSLKSVEVKTGAVYSQKTVFDAALSSRRVADLSFLLKDKKKALRLLEEDILAADKKLESILASADGIQNTADTSVCMHHKANVLFNVMRGGCFTENNTIRIDDFIDFVRERNSVLAEECIKVLDRRSGTILYEDLYKRCAASSASVFRLFSEYLPLSFSRRHGDPSRPWNRFSVKLKKADGSPLFNYEGNWRDIFQNWEALAHSYPAFLPSMIAKFLNAITVDGFNPYRITRSGIDWEVPDPEDPWAHIGYWNDHQIIYLLRLLELQYEINASELCRFMDEPIYTTSLIPYRLKPYERIRENPRDTIVFDRSLDKAINALIPNLGTDAKLVRSGLQGAEGNVPSMVSLAAKLLQILCTKLASYVPGGGIWLNTQRPEWNDANNALAGYGLSMVTLYYLRRFVSFSERLFETDGSDSYAVPQELASFFRGLAILFIESECADLCGEKKRKDFVDAAGQLFEKEREALYEFGYTESVRLPTADILTAFKAFLKHIDYAIRTNKRKDGLYHAYNMLTVYGDRMKVSNLSEMLEGQVAVLSSGALNPEEAVSVCRALASSRLYEKRQNSYILYPDKKLPSFMQKNCFTAEKAERIPLLKKMLREKDTRIIEKDENGFCHFNADFANAGILKEKLSGCGFSESKDLVLELYEQTFHHASFTGRSGTFYAYEGLGSIYWHMVSKLLLAVQECFFAAEENSPAKAELAAYYYAVRSGLSFNKTPDLYGAFPTDPYSHTPSGRGACQPGMTGQVKEEILTRWGELGLFVQNGRLRIAPALLHKREFGSDGSLSFLRFGIPFCYRIIRDRNKECIVIDGKRYDGLTLETEPSKRLFFRAGGIRELCAYIAEDRLTE